MGWRGRSRQESMPTALTLTLALAVTLAANESWPYRGLHGVTLHQARSTSPSRESTVDNCMWRDGIAQFSYPPLPCRFGKAGFHRLAFAV